jgi:hypothetical protein
LVEDDHWLRSALVELQGASMPTSVEFSPYSDAIVLLSQKKGRNKIGTFAERQLLREIYTLSDRRLKRMMYVFQLMTEKD